LEYLDVFDFFNVPRLPFAPGTDVGNIGGNVGDLQIPDFSNGANEFNITNYMVSFL